MQREVIFPAHYGCTTSLAAIVRQGLKSGRHLRYVVERRETHHHHRFACRRPAFGGVKENITSSIPAAEGPLLLAPGLGGVVRDAMGHGANDRCLQKEGRRAKRLADEVSSW
jgi:hypothetical protein